MLTHFLMYVPRTYAARRLLWGALPLLCLLVLLSACGSGSGGTTTGTPNATPPSTNSGGGSSGGTPSGQGNNPPAQTVTMPPTQTACPADGTARAAVMQPLALGPHQNLVYVYNEVPANTSTAYGHLKRYDASNGQKTTIATSGIAIQQAQVSADGQWVLFISTPDPRGDARHSGLLQLVRMDGQGLQTLYCFPKVTTNIPPTAQWSGDQSSILLTTDTANTTSTITLLTVVSGALRNEVTLTDNNQLYRESVVTWLDNSRAYVIKSGRQGPLPPITLYLLNTNSGAMSQVLTHSVRMSAFSLDSSYDGTKLFVGYCLQAANPFDSTLTSSPATGGAQQTLLHPGATTCLQNVRAINGTTLLVLVLNTNAGMTSFNYQVSTLHLDGSGQQTLTTINRPAGQGLTLDFNESSQFPWSSVSRDGSLYALQSNNPDTKTQQILIGSFGGGNPGAIASTNGLSGVSLAGWTTL